MWPRTVEVMLGLWLGASPFIFQHPASEPAFWWTDFVCAFLIVTISLASFWSRTLHAHVLNLGVALWLVGFGYLAFGASPPPAAQNELTVGLLLLIVAIIPSEATLPPREWRKESA